MHGKFLRNCAISCGFVLVSLAAVANDEPAGQPVLAIDSGKIAGESAGDMVVFRGIPYAKPPVGPLRWRAPQPVSAWNGVRDATKFGPSCPQDTSDPKLDILKIGGAPPPTSEDCLTLNVWAPAHTTKHMPVMFWIHGGAGRIGAGSLPYYDGSSFAHDGVVLVTINYRLGHLGAFAYPGLAEEAARKGEFTGTYSLMDQIAALNWVKRNIANFGGDPGNVTIFGESSGGISVFYLLESPPAKGLFQKAIIESGGGWFGPLGDADQAIKRGKEIAAAAGAPNATLDQLRSLPAKAITDVSGDSAGAPDPALVPDSATIAVASGRYSPVPLMIGVNDGEDSLINRAIGKAVAQVNDDALAKARTLYGANLDRETAARYTFRDELATAPARWVAARWTAPAYLYRFEHVTQSYRPTRQRATHGAEIFYVFKTLGREPDQISHPEHSDDELSDEVHARWVAFAKSGSPNVPGLVHWPVYSGDTDQWMVFGQDHSSVQANVLKPQLDSYESSIAPLIFYLRVKAAFARFFSWL
jgi:para-nitrobenzyl esterase